MYIPKFWCGVIATLFIEIAIIVMWTLYTDYKNKKKGAK